MDKNAIKKYAVWARRELIEKVSQKALQYGIEDGKELDPRLDSINGVLLTDDEKKQRQALIRKINENGYTQVMEEVAYTWFNRFIALRFMEVNGYLPSHVRVFTDEAGEFKPQIMSEALHLEFDAIDKDRVMEMKQSNEDDALYKYLLIAQCNELNKVLPGLFQRINDYTELLLPDYLLRDGSVLEQMVNKTDGIKEEDWTDQVQIIGWLYQYYNTEPKENVFAELKNKKKVEKSKIPAATQLFTPDWIVKYMVENSLGRFWLNGHDSDVLKNKWEFYIEEYAQDHTFKDLEYYRSVRPEDIKCIDPCMGSGHILAYMFDILIDIYTDCGYSPREATESILKNNIYGTDVDERAAQLAEFSVMMKARQYDRRVLQKEIRPNVFAIKESNTIDKDFIEHFGNTERSRIAIQCLVRTLEDAKNYGSLITIEQLDFEQLENRLNEIKEENSLYSILGRNTVEPIINTAKMLARKYEVVVTNPPYMNSGSMNESLLSFIKEKYENSKADLYSAFIERCGSMLNSYGFQAMITQHSWMFLSRFEKLRELVDKKSIVNMAHLGTRAFDEISGEVVQTTTFVLSNNKIDDYLGIYVRLVSGTSEKEKCDMYLSGNHRYIFNQNDFKNIPGNPVAYWVGDKLMDAFKGTLLRQIGQTRQGFATGGNDDFLRFWYEADFNRIGFGIKSVQDFLDSDFLYAPCNKGGETRKWYGNNYIVCKFDQYSYNKLLQQGNHLPSREYYFREGLTWSTLGNMLSMRYSPEGFVFETKGSMLFTNSDEDLLYVLGVLNSNVAMEALKILCPTIDFHEGPVSNVPIVYSSKEKVKEIVIENISIAKNDWDSYELSWDFKKHPLVRNVSRIGDAYAEWSEECSTRFETLKKNEETINSILSEAYGLELDCTVDEKDITLSRVDMESTIKDFISYAVGCMFGRYSLDVEGIICTSPTLEKSNYCSFEADGDNIIPICDDEYFTDDIVARFVKFVSTIYGDECLEENLSFISNALGGDGSSRDTIRNYFLNGFYKDHVKKYQKKPIYWQFDSGKKNGFKCLVYAHRYKSDLLARIRTDYVHEQQSRYRTAVQSLNERINKEDKNAVKLKRQVQRINEQAEELHAYEEQIHHLADMMMSISIDDGITFNYGKFKDVLAKI